MQYLLTAEQMKACDETTITQMGMPSLVLMERAALAVRDAVLEYYPDAKRILVLCGSGNNGGDGFAAARLLNLCGKTAEVLFIGKHDSMTKETASQAQIFQNYGGAYVADEAPVRNYDLILDALFGIGLSRDLIGRYADRVRAVNYSGIPVLAVDIPSGVNADDGSIMGEAVRAERTVTFAFKKRGHMLFPGAEYCGDVLVRAIGITAGGLNEPEPALVYEMEAQDLASLLPQRSPSANKGTYGKLLLIGGRKGMAGAMVLAGKSALRTGCGLVCIASDPENRVILQSQVPEALFVPWDEDLQKQLDWADAVAIGPGLGTLPQSRSILETVLKNWSGPVVLDADALNLIADGAKERSASGEQGAAAIGDPDMERIAPVITPHPGEMARLLNGEGKEASAYSVAAEPIDTACGYAREHGCITVLKGARTVITDGEETFLNTAGNEGMATGGSGDVLTGIIGSLLAQGAEPLEAAKAGVLLHAMAGDAAAEDLGTRSLTAGSIADHIAKAL